MVRRRVRGGVDRERMAKVIAGAKAGQSERAGGYREKALALMPHVCGRCCKEFSGKALKELTVHHKDHNHDNNPPDGSNWELLCVYCHDDEHQDAVARDKPSGSRLVHEDGGGEGMGNRPFEGLLGGEEKGGE